MLDDLYETGQERILCRGNIWLKDDVEEVYGHKAEVYFCEQDNRFLYVFEDGHFYDEEEWGEIDVLSKAKMGISDNTVYRRLDDGVKAVSSGYVNYHDYYFAVKAGKCVNMHAFEAPIIDRMPCEKTVNVDEEKRCDN